MPKIPAIDDYLSRFSHLPPVEWQNAAYEGVSGRSFDAALVIPACAEGASLIETIRSAERNEGSLLQIIILNKNECHPATFATENRRSIAAIAARFTRCGIASFESQNGVILVYDAGDMPRKQGVGLARKIGFDFALHLRACGQIQSAFIHSTDADVVFPAGFFDSLPKDASKTAALVHPFIHRAEVAELTPFANAYDAWLRYYVHGLAFAESPYAYHSIGSTLSVAAQAYAQVRGFPRRAAGEDFHLLNKARQVGDIVVSDTSPIQIAARLSDRVPFGTGRAIDALQQGNSQRIIAYPPQVFIELKRLLRAFRDGADNGRPLTQSCDIHSVSDQARAFFSSTKMNFERLDNVIAAQPNRFSRRRALGTAFDALRTLQFVRYLSKTHPAITIDEATSQATFIDSGAGNRWRQSYCRASQW